MLLTLNLFVTFTITATIFLYFYLTRNFNHWKKKNVQYIKPMPLFGNVFKVFTLQLSIAEFLNELYNMTKLPFFGFYVFDKPFMLIRDPELIKMCLIKDFEYFNDRSVVENRKDDEIGSNILFLLKNPTWRPVRVKISSAFSTGKMRSLLPLMVEATNDLSSYLGEIATKQDSTETREMCMKFTTDVISSCAFGINAHCFQHENASFREASRRIFDWNFSRKVQMGCYFFAPFLVRLLKMKFLEPNAAKFIEDIFHDTVTNRENSHIFRGDLIDALIDIKKHNSYNDYKFDAKMLAAQAAQFFIAGFETTGSTISFSLYELSQNPLVQDRLRGEIQTNLKKYGGITYEAIQEMKYLDMTIKETLRKYPVVPFLDRRCTKPYRIPGTDVVIEKGVPIYIPLLGLHYDPQYFPDPHKYDPERFTYENRSSRSNYCYLPFGDGPHNCIGARFGVLGTKVALIRILSEYKVELSKNTPVPLKYDPKGFLIAPENGVNLHFKKLIVS